MFANPPTDDASHRSIHVDLTHPVPHGTNVLRGVIIADRDLQLSAQYYTDADYAAVELM